MPKENISVTLDPELLTRIEDFVDSDAGKKIVKDRSDLVTKATNFFMDLMEGKHYDVPPNRVMVPATMDSKLFEILKDLTVEMSPHKNIEYGTWLELMVSSLLEEDKTLWDAWIISRGMKKKMFEWLEKYKAKLGDEK